MSSNEQNEDTFNLEDLFTVKEYSTVSITLPCYQSAAKCSHEEPELENQGNLTLNIICSTAASTDYDLTGQILWPVSGENRSKHGNRKPKLLQLCLISYGHERALLIKS